VFSGDQPVVFDRGGQRHLVAAQALESVEAVKHSLRQRLVA